MNSAVITPCSHFFHAGCLKKWLYVQETCPLCHSQLKSQSPTTTVPNQETPAANQNPAGQEEATTKQKDGALPGDGKEEGTGKLDGDNGHEGSAGESSSSGVSSAPQDMVKTPSSSSSSSSSSSFPSPLVAESKNQSPTEHPSSSSSSSSDTLDMPLTPSNFHHSSSQPLVQADKTPAEPEPAPQLNAGFLLDSQESPTGPSSQPDQPTSPSEEQSPTQCSL